MPRWLLLFPCLFVILMPKAGAAWGYEGHKIVCEIAYQELNPKARAVVERLIELDPEFHSFALSCIWADKVANSTRPETKGWHFINLQRADRRVDPKRCPPTEGCVLSAIAQNRAVLANPKAPPMARLEALKYLGHFVADIHQPLHLSLGEDRGGNFIPVRWMNFQESNLHAVWDTEMIRDQESGLHMRWKKLAALLSARITPTERKAWLKGSALDWANESYEITRAPQTRYLSAPPNQLIELGEEYERAELPVVDLRLEMAGVRLGALLNGLLER